MVHVVLPSTLDANELRPGMFADTAVRTLIEELESLGGQKSRLLFAMAGGAQVIQFGDTNLKGQDIGTRNVHAIRSQLQALKFTLTGIDVGGNLARTLLLHAESGAVTVRTCTKGEQLLCNLRGTA